MSKDKNNVFFKSYFGKLLKRITPKNMSRNTAYIHEDEKGRIHDYDIVYSISRVEVIIESISENGLNVEIDDNEIIDKIKQKIINEQEEDDNDDYQFEHLAD